MILFGFGFFAGVVAGSLFWMVVIGFGEADRELQEKADLLAALAERQAEREKHNGGVS